MSKETNSFDSNEVHHGRNIKHLRQIFDIKQIHLAMDLGLCQQAISRIEAQRAINDDTLNQFAKVFGVTSKYIKKFDYNIVVDFIKYASKNIDNLSGNNGAGYNYNSFIINKEIKICDANEKYYERLAKAAKDKGIELREANESHEN